MPPVKETRKKKYPEIKRHPGNGSGAITVEGMKELMGFTLDKDEAKKLGCKEPLFKNRAGNSVYFTNNQTNRPFDINFVEGLIQEKHCKRYRWNGEPILIGEYGSVLSGQHNGAMLILAEEDRIADPDRFGTSAYTLEKDVTFGISEDDDVVNTIDSGKSRTEMDVVYRSKLFRSKKPSERLMYAKVFAAAVKFLFERVGASNKSMNPYAHMRTLTGAVDFYERHPTLMKIVEHVVVEGKGEPIAFTPLGICAALGYLMAASATDGNLYRKQIPPQEKGRNGIDLANLALAKEFILTLCENGTNTENARLAAVKQAIAAGHKEADITSPLGTKEKSAIWAHAWDLFKDAPKKVIEKKQLKLKYRTNEKGVEVLDDFPTFGGIDLGPLATKYKPEDEEQEGDKLNSEANGEAGDEVAAELMKLSKGLDKAKSKCKDRVLLYKNGKPGIYFAKGEDAEIVAEALSIKDIGTLPDGPCYVSVSAEDDAALKEVATTIAESAEIGVSAWNGKSVQRLAEAPVTPEEEEAGDEATEE